MQTSFIRVAGTVQEIHLKTAYDDEFQKQETLSKLVTVEDSLETHGIKFTINFSSTLHDRRIDLDNGWAITLGRGLDFYQRTETWHEIGIYDLDLRQCQETTIGYSKTP